MMQPICVPLLPVLLEKGKVQNRMIGPAINLQKVEINSTQRIFFVGLVKTVDSEKMQVSRRTDPGNASIAINKDISPDTVHSRQVRQQQSARPQRNKKSHSKEPTLDEDTTNGVEYNFDFINNYEIKSGDQVINVKGNLKHNVSFWKSVLQANDFIVNTIEFGYRIPFNIEPCCIYLPNNKSALKHATFVEKSIDELLTTNCINEVECPPFVVNPLTVSVQSSGKIRLVLDLRHVNKYVEKQKVKFEGVNEALSFAHNSKYMYKFDLRHGYHHLDVHYDHQKFLGFSWKFGNKTRFFTFTVLPFGLSSAGHIFTKTLRVLVKYWRAMSIPIVVYLDDGWGTAENSEICENMALQVKSDLEKSGFVVNNKKSVWTPVQIMEWLGFNWNLKDGTLEIPVKKFENLKNIISALFECNIHITCRNLAKVCGKIISMLPALGSICQIMTRHLHMTICCRDYWDSFVYLNENVIQELRFWYFYCEKISFRHISYFHRMPERIVFSDASEYAGAGYIVGSNNVAHFMWDKSEKTKSSTWRELKAVSNILQSVHNQLSGKLVKIYTDNQNVTKIIRKGSMKSELQDIALDVFNICLDNNIVLEIEWIPRDKNIQADELSKIFDFDDWGVSDIIFKYFDRLWGPFNCDLFADSRNKKVSRFFSKFFTPGTSGVDAFAYDWSAFNNWIVPPIYLITRVINYMLICKAKGALVIPKWKSAVYWPMIVNHLTYEYKDYIKDFREYRNPKSFFIKGSDENSIFAKQPFNSNVLVLLVDFTT